MAPTRPQAPARPRAVDAGTPSKGGVEMAVPSTGVAAGPGEDDKQKRYQMALQMAQKMKREGGGPAGLAGARKPSPSKKASSSPSKQNPSPAAAHPVPGPARKPSAATSSNASPSSKPARSTGNAPPAAAAPRGASGSAPPPPHHVAAAGARGRGQRTERSPEKARPVSARKEAEEAEEEAEESDESLDFSGAVPAGISGSGGKGFEAGYEGIFDPNRAETPEPYP
ncbi:hypothetical protein T484DRAFT_1805818 [Baffinella frigidus]|nr:hypothetical protein T484DRAFT_1805818 [Cryptophyta sp. CCMP2293]